MIMDLTIVGGGASGLLVAVHLLRSAPEGLRLLLVEKAAQVGEGIAYATRRPEHLLNVTAGRMSAFEGDPEHFVRYLRAQASGAGVSAAELSSVFAGRRQYSGYLRATLDEARAATPASIEILHDQAVALSGTENENVTLTLQSGRTLESACVVLALGNWPRASSLTSGSPVPAGRLLPGWNYQAVADIGADETVVIAGSGLSMVDAALTLVGNGHTGRVHVVSRHGFLPLPHAPHGHIDIDLDALVRMSLRRRVRQLRQYARAARQLGKPWQWLMDTLRAHNVRLWQTLSADDQRRFLHSASRYWDVHRHRIPPSAAATVEAMRTCGQIQKHKGRVDAIVWRDNRLHVRIAARDTSGTLTADRLIDCTGLQSDIRRVSDPLVRSMLERGIIRPGAYGIGIDTNAHGAIVARNGQVRENVYTIGSARIGQLWESVAVPELRLQAGALAQHIIERTHR